MILALLAAHAIAPVSTQWKSLDEDVDGRQTCTISQSFTDGTSVLFAVEGDDAKKNQFGFMASNKAWSIHEGERIGDIAVTTESYSFGSIANTGPGLFIVKSFLYGLMPFLRSAADNSFVIKISERNSEIGPYSTAGLKPAVDKLEACMGRRFSKSNDPFAK